jgi:cyclopropane fatty-acyl-phospholipid synthase-like methyltransferase
MDLIDRATVIHYHRHRIAEFGVDDARAMGWVNEASQASRFECIAQAADFNDSSVLDLGCGTGDLKAFLDARFGGVSYLGIDAVPEFVSQARVRHAGAPQTSFEAGDFASMLFPRVDHVVACGALNYRSSRPQDLFSAIAKMHVTAARTVLFTVLDEAHFDGHPLLVGRNVDEIVAFCEKLSPTVEVRRGHAVNDALVVMRAG